MQMSHVLFWSNRCGFKPVVAVREHSSSSHVYCRQSVENIQTLWKNKPVSRCSFYVRVEQYRSRYFSVALAGSLSLYATLTLWCSRACFAPKQHVINQSMACFENRLADTCSVQVHYQNSAHRAKIWRGMRYVSRVCIISVTLSLLTQANLLANGLLVIAVVQILHDL